MSSKPQQPSIELPAEAKLRADPSGKVIEIAYRKDKFYSEYEVGARVKELFEQFQFLESTAKKNTNPAMQRILFDELKMLQTWIRDLKQIHRYFRRNK